MANITVQKGDITKLNIDCIVNAANKSLQGGGGVDGAIHAAAGPALKAFTSRLGGCETGDAKISPGFDLPADHIIHTVGPVWDGGENDEPELLKACYQNSLELAKENNIKSIAFPGISTGVYGYPKKEASKIAVATIGDFLEENNEGMKVVLIAYSDEDYRHFQEAVDSLEK